MKKIKVTYYKKIDDEWATFTKYFSKLEEAMEFMTGFTSVRKFEVYIDRN